MLELNAIKLSRETAKAMFPKQYEMGDKFDKKLKAMVTEVFDENKGDISMAFTVVSAVMSMQLAKLYAISGTDPTSALKAMGDVMLATYKDYYELEKKDKK
jgi:hypothetical protein